MKKILFNECPNPSWLNNYVDSLPPLATVEVLNVNLKRDYRARYSWSTNELSWYIEFEDERDYMAMVLKWA